MPAEMLVRLTRILQLTLAHKGSKNIEEEING
jgi:hypothetical protein